MRKLLLTPIACLALLGCDNSNESLDSLIASAESNVSERQVADVAAKCDASTSDVETGLTYEALKQSFGTDTCQDLAASLVIVQEINLANSGIKDLVPLVDAGNLSVLDISGNRVEDLGPLATLRNLSSLNISNNGLSDLQPIESLITLATLSANRNNIENISALSGLFNLLSLNLENNAVTDASPLSNLQKLVELKMRNNTLGTSLLKSSENCEITESSSQVFRDFCNSRNQVKPFIDYCNNYDNESAAIKTTVDRVKGAMTCDEADAYLAEQEELDLQANPADPSVPRLTDVSPLASLINLKRLNLNYNAITDVEPISYLVNLNGLRIQGNGIEDISSLSFLQNLVTLDAAVNKISDISAVSQLTNVTGFVLNHNNISDVSPLSGLPFLQGLAMKDNLITNPAALASLPQLLVLDISHNQIESFASIAGLPQLTSVGWTCNRVGTTIKPDETNCPTGNSSGSFKDTCELMIALPDNDGVEQDDDNTNDRQGYTDVTCPTEVAQHIGLRATFYD
ncbi:MAG: leucine-rich repeat domain-containing protein [Pseudobacteriovorax sp.]|nr:leucine-rich repeat domain-containing protein [Pseudobacteriovorax sp.]